MMTCLNNFDGWSRPSQNRFILRRLDSVIYRCGKICVFLPINKNEHTVYSLAADKG